VIHATRGLLDALLALASDRDPRGLTVSVATTPAGELPEAGLAPDEPVFTDFYLPDAGRSVSAVFGMDLGTPAAQGRFISHPEGNLSVTREDDLHEVVFVAVPPYDADSVAAFDRSGRRLQLSVLDVEPPEVTLGD
jgi:hypothetical protein